ncbi:UDP-N-acetylglucosamine 2-epimerase [Desulfocapsa sulfexigens DSM 10523]|uniref:UDP-N-acetylglucosamine 2-epimerase n=1 Tax=Desulfocapsa sulfexigens (strain DSM 10523 / SB164P1) TaxID=1167006 RepID=M1PBE5_DESSD|nr:UDP-N-acetylglucosamine 2-epimerase (non-hydrolyzing) [Desulfocapsa sulfexigens]AGF78952.1 UDP-N-acetylglucosamine 2-epimerase [Desulfocapsa sulfexigens DSM 10523]
MKIITVVGARPQFIKAAAVSRAIIEHNQNNRFAIQENILHTGQHYDEKMSSVFFDQLEIPKPKYNLGITEKTHGAMTGKMLEQIETVLMKEAPDILLVYGDTNSTLAGALAASKLHIPVAHVEAGLRSFNRAMPEEVNRVLTDHISDFLFCPTQTAVSNLHNEGVVEHIHNVGDVMYDVTLMYREKAEKQYTLSNWGVGEKGYVLCTVHRAENTDDKKRLQDVFLALNEMAHDIPVILPLHPRTHKMLCEYGLEHLLKKLQVIEPLSYLEMTRLEMSAKAIVTDSGGIQKEAYFHRVPCLTLRDETEWIETVAMGCNFLCGAERKTILAGWASIANSDNVFATVDEQGELPYGNGFASRLIVEKLL